VRETGDAKFDFTGCFVTATVSPPLDFPFQSIYLCETGPSGIRVEHGTGGQGSFFDASMSLVDFWTCRKSVWIFPNLGLGYSGANNAWMFLYRAD